MGGKLANDTCDKDISRQVGQQLFSQKSFKYMDINRYHQRTQSINQSEPDLYSATCTIRCPMALSKVHQTLMLSISMFNADTWTLKEEHKSKMSVLRRILSITRRDRIRNTDVNELVIDRHYVGPAEKATIVHSPCGTDWDRFPNILLYGHISGTRSRGHPKKKWIDDNRGDCESHLS